jgi:translation initiation factor 5
LQDVSDAFYRYKMERLQSKIEGKGNGIKTVIVNLSSVSQSLSRPPSCKPWIQFAISPIR